VPHRENMSKLVRSFRVHAVVGLGLVTALAGCTVKKGRSLVLVDLTSEVTPLDRARVVVVYGSAGKVGDAEVTWNGTSPATYNLGVFVDQSVSGPVTVYACGFAGGAGVARTDTPPKQTNVEPGEPSAAVSLTLVAGAPAAVCGSAGPGAGGAGGSNTAGTGGSGGPAGAGGGAIAGSGGLAVAGSGGSPIAGSGGLAVAGSGGSPVGGAGGRAGAGGVSPGGSGGGAAGKGGGAAGAGPGGSGGGAAGAGMPPHWYGQVAVAADATASESLPAVAVDAAGNAVTVFQHSSQIWFSTFGAAAGLWSAPAPIDSRGSLQNPSVAVDKNGVWLAVWESNTSSTANRGLFQSTSTDGTHWTAPAAIVTTAAYGPVLAMNADGTALLAWTEVVGGTMYQAMAATRAATGAAWSASTILRPGDDNGDRLPAVVVSGKGEAFVLWTQSDAADWNSIWMRQWSATAGWGTATLFESFTEQRADTPALAANKNGDVIGTYVQLDSSATTMQLLSRRYTPGSGFGPPLKVAEADTIDWSVPPTVTLDDGGIATAAWAAQAPSKFQVYASRLGPTDTAWPASPTMLENDDDAADDDSNNYYARTTNPIVKAAPSGAVTLIWRKRAGTRFDLAARRFEGGAWGTASLLETRNDYPIAWPALAVGAGGTAVAVWYYNTELDIWGNVFR
jgi:hypothetical protein